MIDNPYAPPKPSFVPGYYRFNLAAARWREIMRISRGNWPLFVGVASSKLFNQPYFLDASHYGSTHFLDDELPGDVAAAMAPYRDAWRTMGILLTVAYGHRSLYSKSWMVSGLSDDRLAIPTLVHFKTFTGITTTYSSIGTYFVTDECLISTTENNAFDDPNWLSSVVLEKAASVEELWNTHLERLRSSATSPRPVSNLREVVAYHNRKMDFYWWERRVLHEISEAEFCELQEVATAALNAFGANVS